VLDRYLTVAVTTLLVLAALSIWIAWWLAGRVLRPVAAMAEAARTMSVTDLSQRIDLDAPPGELKQLADTFDQLLARIDTLVASQQRFVANAAHELRTQLAVQRSAAEIGLADPSPERVERIRTMLLEAATENELLLEGLLLLAVTDQGLQRFDSVAVDQLVDTVARELAAAAAQNQVQIDTSLGSLVVVGDSVLLKHLIRNLVVNAITYNDPVGGRVHIATGSDELVITNTGPVIPPEEVSGLFEPFRRLNVRQHRQGEGAGLGLAIVSSIARAHHATVAAEANPPGGLTVRIRF
jgi:signal transduction histidine kinase